DLWNRARRSPRAAPVPDRACADDASAGTAREVRASVENALVARLPRPLRAVRRLRDSAVAEQAGPVHEVVTPDDYQESCREHRNEPESKHFPHLVWPPIVAFATLSAAPTEKLITRAGGSGGGR